MTGSAGRVLLGAFLGMAAVGFGLFVHDVVMRDGHEALDRTKYEEKIHSDKCLKARVEFFEDCFQWGRGRFECEALWAQKHGHVFDGSPTNEWVDEIDCSSEVK